MSGRPPRRHQVINSGLRKHPMGGRCVCGAPPPKLSRGFSDRIGPVAVPERTGGILAAQFWLGDNIARHRRLTGLTQDALGARLGVTAQAVSKWERRVACPDIMLLPAIADLFGITLDELFAGAIDSFHLKSE